MAKKDERPNDLVQIRHKSQKKEVAPGTTSRRAFERIWKDKGWEIVERDSTKATTSANPST